MTQERVTSICEAHNVDPKGAQLFNEDWIISGTGDLIGSPKCGWTYGIYDNNHDGVDWLDHMYEKPWCDIYKFVPAYIEALCRMNIRECVVSAGYRKERIRPFELRGRVEELRRLADRVKVGADYRF